MDGYKGTSESYNLDLINKKNALTLTLYYQRVMVVFDKYIKRKIIYLCIHYYINIYTIYIQK